MLELAVAHSEHKCFGNVGNDQEALPNMYLPKTVLPEKPQGIW